VATVANDRLMIPYVSVDSLTSGACLRKQALAALPPHSRNAILTLFIVQGKKPIERGNDDFLIGDPPARSP
jgi:hypothetical protein